MAAQRCSDRGKGLANGFKSASGSSRSRSYTAASSAVSRVSMRLPSYATVRRLWVVAAAKRGASTSASTGGAPRAAVACHAQPAPDVAGRSWIQKLAGVVREFWISPGANSRVVVRGSICSPSCRGEASLPRGDGVVCVDEHAVDEFRRSPAPTRPRRTNRSWAASPPRSGRGQHPTPQMQWST